MNTPPPASQLRRWVPGGGQPTAEHLNEPIDYINAFRLGQGLTGGVADGPWPAFTFIGKVVTAGPNGEAAPTDSSYWVQEQAIVGGTGGSIPTTLTLVEDTTNRAGPAPEPNIHRVHNLAEYESGTHWLAEGEKVLVAAYEDRGETQHVRYVMHAAPVPPALRPCNVTQTGGSNGDETTAPSYTYAVTDAITGVEVGTDMVDEWGCGIGPYSAGTRGSYYINADGDPVLYQVNEHATAGECPEGA